MASWLQPGIAIQTHRTIQDKYYVHTDMTWTLAKRQRNDSVEEGIKEVLFTLSSLWAGYITMMLRNLPVACLKKNESNHDAITRPLLSTNILY